MLLALAAHSKLPEGEPLRRRAEQARAYLEQAGLTDSPVLLVDIGSGGTTQRVLEELLHTQLYRRFPEIGCVLHTHSHVQTVASRLFAPQGHVRFEGYELQKAFYGDTTHEGAMDVPVFPNTQDMPELAVWVDAKLDEQCMWGYLIDGHGLYAWGRDMAEARRHLEAFEFLLGCELELRRLS